MERLVPLEGGRNFRDLGGYQTGDGRRVRWRALFRSGVLSYLTAQDWRHLSELGVRTVCDLRAPHERAREPVRPRPVDVHWDEWDYDPRDVSLRSHLTAHAALTAGDGALEHDGALPAVASPVRDSIRGRLSAPRGRRHALDHQLLGWQGPYRCCLGPRALESRRGSRRRAGRLRADERSRRSRAGAVHAPTQQRRCRRRARPLDEARDGRAGAAAGRTRGVPRGGLRSDRRRLRLRRRVRARLPGRERRRAQRLRDRLLEPD